MKAVTIDKYRPTFFDWPKEYGEGEDAELCVIVLGTFFGEPAWTDGHILMAGEAPHDATSKPVDFASVEKRCLLESLKVIRPLGVVADTRYNVVLFDDLSTVQSKYYRLVVEAWPDAEFFGDGHARQITARSQGKPVAALMPIGCEARDQYAALLQSANAEKSQPVTDNPEERQLQKESP